MTAKHSDRAQPVDAEIVSDGESADSKAPVPHEGEDRWMNTFFHPYSGMLIIGVDLAAFGANAPTGFWLTPLICVLAFLVTFCGVYKIQRSKGGDNRAPAMWKAALGGVAAGLPLPIAGTFVGMSILVLSGLPTSTSGAAKAAKDVFPFPGKK